jgi:hypothetical protein
VKAEWCGKPTAEAKCALPPGHEGLCCTGLEASLVGKCNDLRTSLSSLRDEVKQVAVWWERDMCAGTGDLYGIAARLRSLLRAERT